MVRNKRGEVVTITVIALAFLSGIIGLWFGQTKYAKAFGLGSTDQKTKQTVVTKIESKPIIVTGQDGKQYILQSTKTETSSLDTCEEAKMTIWQKLMLLPKLWLLLMILGIFFPPIAGIMGMVNSRLKGAAKQIVTGVEKGLAAVPAESKTKILDELSKTYDTTTKLMVSKLKQK